MSALTKYITFIVILVTSSYAVANLDLPIGGQVKEIGQAGDRSIVTIPRISEKPAYVLRGIQNTTTIDYSPEDNITAAAGEGTIKLWHLPEEQPALDIDPGEGFQVLSLRFPNGKGVIAASGRTMDNAGSVRIFDISSGKLTFQIDDPEPLVNVDFHSDGRYLLSTGITYIKVWDLKDRNVVVIPKNNPESIGYFFMDGRYVLQSDSLSLYDLRKGKKTGILDAAIPIFFRKAHDNKYVWTSRDGLSMVHTPSGRREFIPINTQGVYAFDIAPDGRWGLFLKDGQKMDVIDLLRGKTVKTIGLKSVPADVTISSDNSSAYVIYRSGDIAVFDIGNKNILRNTRFYAKKILDMAVQKIGLFVMNKE